MNKIEQHTADVPADWDDYVRAHPDGSPWHLRHWGGVIQGLFGHQPHYLMARDEAGRCSGVLPLIEMKSRLFGHFICSMPYFNYGGVLASAPDTTAALISAAATLAAERGAGHVELRHLHDSGQGLQQQTRKVAMWLDLPESAEELFKSLPAKLRSQVRRPSKAGATAVVGGPELLDDFYAVFCRNMRDLGTPVYPRAFFARVLETEPGSRIVTASVDGRTVAAGILVGFGQRIEIPWASSLREFNRIGINMLLYWRAFEHAIDSGYRTFDFGRSTHGEGTWRFKRQWGAQEVPMIWEYWLPPGQALPALNPDNPKFRLAVRIWQKLPLWLTNRLGPLLVRNIP